MARLSLSDEAERLLFMRGKVFIQGEFSARVHVGSFWLPFRLLFCLRTLVVSVLVLHVVTLPCVSML